MKLRPLKIIVFAICTLLLAAAVIAAQKKSIQPDVTKIPEGKGWKVSGRNVTAVTDEKHKAVQFDEAAGQGFAWLDGIEFDNGVIELDIKGKDLLQKSFVGVAFRGVDDSTQDVVYFRPFNFKAEDPVRRIHAVQYVSHPTFTWKKLREEHPDQYEKPIFPKADMPAPDPNGWFHARIVVAKPKISVFVNDAKEPSLVVNELSDRKGGMVALWVGEGSGGTFANLKITPAK